MKFLFIGGTGLISSACSELAIQRGHELFLLNRSASKKYPAPQGATVLQADIYNNLSQ
ncbi:MAG TPA: NAD-dependent dehydratase, partial [Anaerolineae bacterium]|nr:NAD-dependent dehydratase [Anaerolineae bacterium]